jgi:hypothetical protein
MPPSLNAVKARISLRIRLPERTLTADIAAKSLRKAQTAIRDAAMIRLSSRSWD